MDADISAEPLFPEYREESSKVGNEEADIEQRLDVDDLLGWTTPRGGIEGAQGRARVDSVDEDSHIGGGDLILSSSSLGLDADYEAELMAEDKPAC